VDNSDLQNHPDLMIVAVLDTFFARRGTYQLSTQVAFQGRAHRPSSTGSGLNPILAKELDGAPTHATAKHNISILRFDKCWHLTWLVTILKGVGNHLYSFEFCTFYIHQGKKRAASKMVSDYAF
jgi:hypothetical protein